MAEEQTEPKTARVVGGAPRETMVPLEFPVEFDDKTWTEIKVRRVSGKEVEEYMEALGRGEQPMPPMFECPREVYDAMDDDDRLALDEAVIPFLPRRLKAAAEQGPPAAGLTSGS
ncbi:phage tail assembly protein [Mesorhizobium sp.]|uniref:phage tail assembly protein n=1 Tax=Mesorhizobium sp. TaxID=1871066 RepID=UPI000FE80714|nr:phage tail assembly protein [Mesorhizobium sp.]RWM29396.1 MAG: phage tail assembly protein [Mesorhizobium sp.]